MEMSVTPVEDNPAPKSTGSLVQISSIYIDLKIPKERNETESCQHNFSIRGYASEMRIKNPKAFLPFASSDIDLPPIQVPNSRWWGCQECRRKIDSRSATEDITVPCNCSTSHGDTAMVHHPQIVLRSPSLNSHYLQPSSDPPESNDAGTEDAAATGGNSGQIEPISDKSGSVRCEEPAAQIENSINATDDGSADIPADVKGKSADVKQKAKPTPSRAGDGFNQRLEISVSGADNSIGAPLQVEGCGNASSESDQSKKHDNSSGASRRKRKLRYLTDLLGDKGNPRSDHPRQDDSSIHKLVTSSGFGTAVSQGQAPCEDVGKSTKNPQKADSDRTLTDIVISSSERQANASSGNKNDCSKRKTDKSPAPVKRKSKQIQVHDRFSPRPGEQLSSKNNVKESDQHAGAANTLFRSFGTSAAAGKTDNHSRNSQSSQVPERGQNNVTQTSSHISKYQLSDLKLGLDLSLKIFPEKIDSLLNKEMPSSSKSVLEKNDIHFGQCSILPASKPDLQKNSPLWDLNQNSVGVEKRILQKDMSCQKEKTYEAQGCPEEINKQSDQMASNRIARGSSDDIPMEIVELMAKNQYERGLADAGNQSFPHRINNSVGRFPEVQGMGPMAQFAKGIPGLTSFSPANARSGMGICSANAGVVKGNSINYFQMNRNRLEAAQPEKNKVSIYNMFPQIQQNFSCRMQYAGSASVSSGSPSNALNMSFGLGMQQKYPAQNPESQHRGKTISDLKPNELKKTQEAHISLSKSGSSEVNSKPKGAVDPYANESIPAMQLLSLMDGKSPGSTFNVGSGKPFAPCSYHPRYGTAERKEFLSRSVFPRQNRLATGTFSVAETSGRSSGRHPVAFSGQPQEQDQSYLARYTGCIPYTGQTSNQGKDKQKATVGASDCAAYLQRYRGRRVLLPEGLSMAQDAKARRIIPREERNCIMNLNPAEYFLPDDAENAFVILGKDLKFPRRKYPREVMRDGAKRPRIAKPKAGKEQPQNPS